MQALPSQSAISRSTAATERHDTYKLSLIQGTTHAVDRLFPVFDQMTQHTCLPNFIHNIIGLIIFVQIITTCAFTFHPIYDDLSGNLAKTVSVFHCISFFIPESPTNTDVMIQFAIIFALSIILLILYSFEIVYFHYKHRFIKWTLYVVRFFTEAISPIFMISSSAAVGIGLDEYLSTKKGRYLTTCLLSLFSYIIYFITYSLGGKLISRSCCIHKNNFSAFDSFPSFAIIAGSSVMVILENIFSWLNSWTYIFLFIAHAVIMSFTYRSFTQFVYHTMFGVVEGVSLLTTIVLSDILMFIVTTFFKDSVPLVVPFVAPYVLMFVSMCAAYPIFIKARNNIISNLTCDGKASLEEKKEFYNTLGLSENPDKLIKYMRVTFLNRIPTFIDFSFPHFCIQASTNQKSTFGTMQIISFFPSESRSLNVLFSRCVSMRQISFQDRFLIYQVNRIKTIRQSSVSSAANDKLNELKSMSKQCEDIVRGFWISNEPSYGYLELMYSKISMVESMWEEALRDFPNNSKFSDEYAYFLCEGKADYEKAIKQKYRSEMVSNGMNFSVDLPFKALAKSFPEFLKESIMDINGNFIKALPKKRGSQSNYTISTVGNSSSRFNSTKEIEIDVVVEESIGRQILTQSKLRMALQKSIDSKTSTPIRLFPIISTVCVVVTLVVIGVMMKLMFDEFSYQREASTRYYLLARLSSGNNLVTAALILKFGHATGRLAAINAYPEDPPGTSNIFDLHAINEVINNFCKDQSSSLVSLLEEISGMAQEGYYVYTIAESILTQKSEYRFCDRNATKRQTVPNTPILTNMKNIQAFQIYAQQKMNDLNETGVKELLFKEEYCAISTNFQVYEKAYRSMFEAFSQDQIKNTKELDKNVMLYSIINIMTVTILSLLVSLITYFIHLFKINKIIKALNNVDGQAKEAAMKSVVNGFEDENEKVSEVGSPSSTCTFVIITTILFNVLFITITILMMVESKSTSSDIGNINSWLVQSSYRTASTLNALHGIVESILIRDYNLAYTSREAYLNFTTLVLEELSEANSLLLDGSDSMSTVFGFDDEIDRINIVDQCEQDSTTSHGLYVCMSTSKQLSVFKDFITYLKANIEDFTDLNNEVTQQMIHLVSSHLFDNLYNTDQRLGKLTEEVYKSMKNKIIIYYVICIVIGVALILFLTIYVTFTMYSQFNSLMVLIKRLSPQDVIASKDLMNYLLNRSATNKENEMCIPQSVIHNSTEGIFGTGINGTIEIVNPAISEMLGYTPEQLLGQPVSTILSETDGPAVLKKMEMMKKGECSTIIEDRATFVSDDSSDVICHVSILGMQKLEISSINSFVFIIRDESDLIKQQQEVEQAKASSEKLLFQILPRDIVVKLNSGEKDISFTVPSASIIFIDIVKFSEYTASLSPQEIMGNLSLVFATFDSLILKYQQMMKIKLIGDVYMAAGGIFAPQDQDPKLHAEEVVRFGIDCQHELEEVNIKLNASLSVRIGINTGGPIIAGVLGTDRPVFDIIGDPINIASRLQSTDIPGRVQISQATKDCINDLDFQIDVRGEVYLKGKGNSMTYFVEKTNNLLMLST